MTGTGVLPELYSYGLRNPVPGELRSADGNLYIGDVGQNNREEINFIANGSVGGQNFGWRLREGTIATPTGGVGGLSRLETSNRSSNTTTPSASRSPAAMSTAGRTRTSTEPTSSPTSSRARSSRSATTGRPLPTFRIAPPNSQNASEADSRSAASRRSPRTGSGIST